MNDASVMPLPREVAPEAFSPCLDVEFARALQHWRMAAERLADLDAIAPATAWQSLEHYLGVSLRQALAQVIAHLRRKVDQTAAALHAATDGARNGLRADRVRALLVEVRQAYLRAETTVDFYADALATRSAPRQAALLRACDHIATRSMAEALTPMGREVPAALTYIDAGLGASVLKAGLRLWDGTIHNPVATIKVTRHSLLRPTSIIHEAGHQVAYQLGWVPELSAALRRRLPSSEIGDLWAGWASEVAADAFAHVHTGFAATATLHDVLDGAEDTVFRFLPGDPHPVSYIRVLMAIEMCRRTFGAGPWDRLAAAWNAKHRLDRCPGDLRAAMEGSARALLLIVETILDTPYDAFRGWSLTRLIDPGRISPAALARLDQDAGASAFTSPYWIWNEAIRLLALTGFRAGLGPHELRHAVTQQEQWMLRLGALRSAA